MQYRSRTPGVRLTHVQDVPNIPIIERWSLYFQWANLAAEDQKKTIKRLEVNKLNLILLHAFAMIRFAGMRI